MEAAASYGRPGTEERQYGIRSPPNGPTDGPADGALPAGRPQRSASKPTAPKPAAGGPLPERPHSKAPGDAAGKPYSIKLYLTNLRL